MYGTGTLEQDTIPGLHQLVMGSESLIFHFNSDSGLTLTVPHGLKAGSRLHES